MVLNFTARHHQTVVRSGTKFRHPRLDARLMSAGRRSAVSAKALRAECLKTYKNRANSAGRWLHPVISFQAHKRDERQAGHETELCHHFSRSSVFHSAGWASDRQQAGAKKTSGAGRPAPIRTLWPPGAAIRQDEPGRHCLSGVFCDRVGLHGCGGHRCQPLLAAGSGRFLTWPPTLPCRRPNLWSRCPRHPNQARCKPRPCPCNSGGSWFWVSRKARPLFFVLRAFGLRRSPQRALAGRISLGPPAGCCRRTSRSSCRRKGRHARNRRLPWPADWARR